MERSMKFGKGSFQVYPVVKMLQQNETSYTTICECWEEFAYNLGLEQGEIDNLDEKLKSGKLAPEKIPRDVLRVWKDAHGDDANLDVLYEALIDLKLEDLAGSIREKFGGGLDLILPTPSKRSKVEDQDQTEHSLYITACESESSASSSDSSIFDEEEAFPPLLLAIREGQSIGFIEMILDDGADVNVKASDHDEVNAAHVVVKSLFDKALSYEEALKILDLLIAKGFRLINEADIDGYSPLQDAMELDDLNEELLTWFYINGADFNATDKSGDSVLFDAISYSQRKRIIRKILEYGANPEHINDRKRNALHISAQFAHESALEIFMEKLNIYEVDEDNCTPVDLLFSDSDLDYYNCLELLYSDDIFGFDPLIDNVPLMTWIKNVRKGGNPFPTLMKIKDTFPISEEMASEALTVIAQEIEVLEKLLPSSLGDDVSDFVSFFAFLIQEKQGKLRLEDNHQWKQESLETLKEIMSNQNFLDELKNSDAVQQTGLGMKVKVTANQGKIDFHLESSSSNIPVENILLCLLTCEEYDNFVKLCKCLSNDESLE